MPTRKKSTRAKKRSKEPQFLVVRGKGNTVFVSLVQYTARSAALARKIDHSRARKGIGKARRAFIVVGRDPLEAAYGVKLHQLPAGPRK